MRFGKVRFKVKQKALKLKQFITRGVKPARWLENDGERELASRKREHVSGAIRLRHYEHPLLRKLTAGQAKLKLFGHVTLGDTSAKALLDLFFPQPDPPKAPEA